MSKPFSVLHLALLARGLANRLSAGSLLLTSVALSIACVPKDVQVQTPSAPPPITWEQKLEWMLRLEDQRILRDPNTPPPVVLKPATASTPAVFAPPPPSDLLRLLQDSEGRTRRRAALAVGRVGLREGVEPLARLLSDGEPEVRQMAAFAIGLIGDPSGRGPLLQALQTTDALVQARAAEALGLIGDKTDAQAIAAVVQAHINAGALASVAPDDETYPFAPPLEAIRLGLGALVRLQSYDAIAAAVLDATGSPRSNWWPVAFALQRVNDPRAAAALTTLAATPGRYTASFAVRGLAASKAASAAATLRALIQQPQQQRQVHPAVVIQAVRGVAALGDAASATALLAIVNDPAGDPALRLEAMTAFGTLATSEHADLLVDLLLDGGADIRAVAYKALARVEPDTFMATIAGLDPDRDWTVRAAMAAALGTLPAERSLPRLTLMLQDRDQRVVPAVLTALGALDAPDIEPLLTERLRAADFVVRATAATVLADRKAHNAVPPIVAAYKESVGDSTYVARAAILAALHRLSPTVARDFLQDALADREWAMRVRAAALLREQGITDTDATIRPAPVRRQPGDPAWAGIVSPAYSPLAFVDTDKGRIEIELAVLDAPLTVDSFVSLARANFFDGIAIHRVVPDFVVQGGDPRGDGEGGPGYAIRDELNQRPYLRGTVGMALDWKDTGGSQFFITHSPAPHLDARYTVFGRVVGGMDVVDRLMPWDVIRQVRIWDGVSTR